MTDNQKNSASLIETYQQTFKETQGKLIEEQDLHLDNEKIDQGQQSGTSEIDIPSSHYFGELINTKINYSPQVYNWVKPENHKLYLSEITKAYHDIAAFKIKNISLSIHQGPQINVKNYFDPDLEEGKSILNYCIPETNKIGFYSLTDICKLHTIGKQYYQERQLSNEWTFSKDTTSITTPLGKIYAINCRTTKQKIDPYLYEITETKASNRGPLLSPKRQASIIYLNNCIYLIGGCTDGQKCSKKNYRYNLKDKKWVCISESNVALRKPTLCAINNRYICKIGGLNEFDYINKIIEMYDSVSDKWSLVRASPRNILEEIQILEDSKALQISDDQIYIFGGKNSNKFNSDTGFVLVISEIRERKKGAAKVSGQFWNVSIGKRNILTFLGGFSKGQVLVHHNCIYGLRTNVSDISSI